MVKILHFINGEYLEIQRISKLSSEIIVVEPENHNYLSILINIKTVKTNFQKP